MSAEPGLVSSGCPRRVSAREQCGRSGGDAESAAAQRWVRVRAYERPTRHPARDPRRGPQPPGVGVIGNREVSCVRDARAYPGPRSIVGALLLKQDHHVDDGAARVVDHSMGVDDAAAIPGRQRCAFALE